MVQYILKRDNVSDSVVNRMQHVDASLMVGGLIGYDFKLSDRQVLGVEFQGRQDVESGNGYLLTLLGRYQAPLLADLTFNGELSSTYASSDYMESYFGVGAADAARSGLDQFQRRQRDQGRQPQPWPRLRPVRWLQPRLRRRLQPPAQ